MNYLVSKSPATTDVHKERWHKHAYHDLHEEFFNKVIIFWFPYVSSRNKDYIHLHLTYIVTEFRDYLCKTWFFNLISFLVLKKLVSLVKFVVYTQGLEAIYSFVWLIVQCMICALLYECFQNSQIRQNST